MICLSKAEDAFSFWVLLAVPVSSMFTFNIWSVLSNMPIYVTSNDELFMQWDTSHFALHIFKEWSFSCCEHSTWGAYTDVMFNMVFPDTRFIVNIRSDIRLISRILSCHFFTQDDSYSISGSVYAMVVEFETFPDLFGFAAFPFCLLYTCNHDLPSMHEVCYLPTLSCHTSNVRSHET